MGNIITPDGYSPEKYPRTKRHAFKYRTAIIWIRAFADDHSKRVRKMMDKFVERNISRWRNCIRVESDDLLK